MKSSVRLIGDESVLFAFEESIEGNWITDRVWATCEVLASNSNVEVLGATVCAVEEGNQCFEERFDKLIQFRYELADIEDPGIELILRRLCASISGVTHLWRAHACHLCPRLLEKFDDSILALVSRILGGDLHDQALEQATLGLSFGG